MESEEYFGKITRHLIENQHKCRAVPKEEFKDLLGLPMRTIDNVLSRMPEFLHSLGLEIVGISQNELVPLSEAKKVFLRKMCIEHTKKAKTIPTLEEKRLFVVFAAIQLENNQFEESKLGSLRVCPYFKGVNILEFFDQYKMNGYLIIRKEKEMPVWSLGWRFYVEYGDCFDLVEYFKEYTTTLQSSS
ncbi:uncharacterized protein VICG_00663 [Vittaforma corneae ATCC 50505]|uniref:MAGE domain-containing protein n=1 Tax=Vittaforma corneae (strain ATCC 50505) TaxID=993615 RepID=L2GNR9_VITCO|nr:uncharacterized protein VICG_00663 [Vittaforma corneae ATCC 50505]ELA42264.1 hypothetical protein VICG_00663 [Vittaforma corneae ATCC 50505]